MPFFQVALFFAHLCTVHLCVASVLCHQFLVSPSFCDLPVLHKQNVIRIPDRGKPVAMLKEVLPSVMVSIALRIR